MSFLKIFIMILLILGASSCARKSNESSKVVIHFDRNAFSGKLQVDRKINTANHNGPDWGLQDPTSLSQLGCFAVLVGADEPGMNESSCSSFSGNTFTFGPRGGFFPIGSNGEIEVPAGENRRIFLMASASADGTCFDNFAQNADFDFNNYSAPFVIGSTVVDLAGAEQVVKVPINNSFTDENKVLTCDFIAPDDNDDQPDTNGAFLTFYNNGELKRHYWIEDNGIPRTVTVNHSGSSVECSTDGTTYTPCGNSFEWDDADYNLVHYVRVLHDDGTEENLNFTPSTVFPGVVFLTCDGADIIGTDTFSSINSRLGTNGQVLCFANGTNISEAAGTGIFAGEDNVVVVRQGHSASIINTDATTLASIFDFNPSSANTYFKILGLQLMSNSTSIAAVDLRYNPASGTGQVHIEDSIIINNAASGYQAVYVTANTMSFNFNLFKSELSSTAGSGGFALQLNTTLVNADIDQSKLQGSSNGLYNANAIVDVTDSTIIGTGASAVPILNYNNGIMDITNSIIEDQSGNGAIINNSGASGTAVLNIDGNVFIRADLNSGMETVAVSNTGSGTNTTDSDNNNNLFCDENINVAGANFTGIVNTASGTFVAASNQGIIQCPAEVLP